MPGLLDGGDVDADLLRDSARHAMSCLIEERPCLNAAPCDRVRRTGERPSTAGLKT